MANTSQDEMQTENVAFERICRDGKGLPTMSAESDEPLQITPRIRDREIKTEIYVKSEPHDPEECVSFKGANVKIESDDFDEIETCTSASFKYEKSEEILVKEETTNIKTESVDAGCVYDLQFDNKMITAQQQMLFQCDFCKRSFHLLGSLRKHITVNHRNFKQYKCDLCDTCFLLKRDLRHHCSSMHETDKRKKGHEKRKPRRPPQFECKYCQKRFVHKKTLRWHLSNHVRYECEYCDMYFFQRKDLLTHSTIHKISEEEKLYECEICKKRLLTQETLRYHKMRQHITGKPYKCQRCDRSFFYKSQLEYHAKFHKDVMQKPFVCSFCNKSFKSEYELKEHTHKHMNERKEKRQSLTRYSLRENIK